MNLGEFRLRLAERSNKPRNPGSYATFGRAVGAPNLPPALIYVARANRRRMRHNLCFRSNAGV